MARKAIKTTRRHGRECPVCQGTGRLSPARYDQIVAQTKASSRLIAELADVRASLKVAQRDAKKTRTLEAAIARIQNGEQQRIDNARKSGEREAAKQLREQLEAANAKATSSAANLAFLQKNFDKQVASQVAERSKAIALEAARRQREKMEREHASPQLVGIMHEHVALGRLRKAFPSWAWEHHGQKGDISGALRDGERTIGTVTIELKNEDCLTLGNHRDGRKARNKTIPDYTVLATSATSVSNGRRRRSRFSGFELTGEKYDFFVVHFLCVDAAIRLIEELCRKNAFASRSASDNTAAGEALVAFVTSKNFKTRMSVMLDEFEERRQRRADVRARIGTYFDRDERSDAMLQLRLNEVDAAISEALRTTALSHLPAAPRLNRGSRPLRAAHRSRKR